MSFEWSHALSTLPPSNKNSYHSAGLAEQLVKMFVSRRLLLFHWLFHLPSFYNFHFHTGRIRLGWSFALVRKVVIHFQECTDIWLHRWITQMHNLKFPPSLLAIPFSVLPQPSEWWNGFQGYNGSKRGKMEPISYPFQTAFSKECLKSCPPSDCNTEHLWTGSAGHLSLLTATVIQADTLRLLPCMHIIWKIMGWRLPHSCVEEVTMLSSGWLATSAPATAKQIIL